MQGFYSIYRSLFALLASDEALHHPSAQGNGRHAPPAYPTFGSAETPYAPPPGANRAERDAGVWVRDFYAVWGEFVTEKKFEWLGAWDSEAGADRRVRRLMERDNKKVRDDHRKEYNDTVRHLVSFIQNRDPRFHAWQQQRARAAKAGSGSLPGSGASTPRGQTASARDKRVNDLHAQLARQREEARLRDAENFQAQSWQQVDTSVLDELVDGPAAPTKAAKPAEAKGDGEEEDDEDAEPEGYECVACNKTFMTENAWDNHERSKKHKQAVFRWVACVSTFGYR